MDENLLPVGDFEAEAETAPGFSGWHPLKSGWLEDMSPDMQAVAKYAQHCLLDNKRSGRELAEAFMQIKAWQGARPELVDGNAPEIVCEEDLGTRLQPETFADFLLSQEYAGALKPYEFAALALLKEISGRVELDVVARKSAFSAAAQHLTLKVGRLYTATLLLRMMDENTERQESIRAIMGCLLRNQSAAS